MVIEHVEQSALLCIFLVLISIHTNGWCRLNPCIYYCSIQTFVGYFTVNVLSRARIMAKTEWGISGGFRDRMVS